jgi:tRNA threonylcarbamoyladenosine biosynthesis protein TsaE
MPISAAQLRRVVSRSADETRAIAGSLAAFAEPGDLVCLWGDLGAGKTVFAKGFGAGLGIRETITSPTFILMAEYEGRLPLFHLDLFRLDEAADVLAGGLVDERRALGVTLIEWPDRLGVALPSERLDIEIVGGADDRREISIRAGTPAMARYLEAETGLAP